MDQDFVPRRYSTWCISAITLSDRAIWNKYVFFRFFTDGSVVTSSRERPAEPHRHVHMKDEFWNIVLLISSPCTGHEMKRPRCQ
jgi:hypothetical protein